MKLKYIIPSLLSVVALLVSCTEKFEHSYLGDLRVSSSYLAISAAGSSTEFTVNSAGNWEIKDVPEWLTITPLTGGAGETKVVASAPATTKSLSGTFKIVSGASVQEVAVSQTAEKTEAVVISVAQALAAIKDNPDGSSAAVRGIVCKIDEISVQYGNATYYLSDDGTFGDGNWIEVYRGKWMEGANFTAGNEFAIGDELVVEGTIVDYKGTPEFSQGSSVVSITKSLISIAQVEMLGVEEGVGKTEFPMEGGSAKITVSAKGNGFHLTIPQDAKSWLHIADFGADYVTLDADVNTGEDRSVSVTLSTEADGVTYTCEQAFTQKGVPPAVTDVTVEQFLAAEVGTAEYRLTGVITELYASDKQGKSFYIADHTGKTLVYRAEGFIEAGAKVGDVISVVGQRGAYKETPQMVNGTFETVKYAATAVTINEFRNVPDDKEKYYLISGTINKVAEADKGAKDDVTKYGNFDLTDETGSVYIYGVLTGWGGAKGEFAKLDLTYGDRLTVIAYKTTYKGLVEGVAVYVSSEKAAQ